MIAIENQLFMITSTDGDDYYETERNVCVATSEDSAQTIVDLLTKGAIYDQEYDDIRDKHIQAWKATNEQPRYDRQRYGEFWGPDATDTGKLAIEVYRANYGIWDTALKASVQAFDEANYHQEKDIADLMKACSLSLGELRRLTYKYVSIVVISPTKER